MKRLATVLALTAVLSAGNIAAPADADAATRYVRDGSYINHNGTRVCLYVRQVRSAWTLWLWDSRGLPVIRRCR